MSRRDALGAQRDCVVEERAKLDFGVAQNIGVGGVSSLVFAQKFGKNAVLVFG